MKHTPETIAKFKNRIPWNKGSGERVIEFSCIECAKTIYAKPKRNRKFCSKPCQYLWRSKNLRGERGCNYGGTGDRRDNKIEIKCTQCMNPFWITPSAYAQDHGERGHFCSRKCYGIWQRIIPNGNAELRAQVRGCFLYRQWKSDVLTRDGFACQWCGERNDLHVDHRKPFSLILQEYEITDIEQAERCSELWNINNGRTLCSACHRKTATYSYRMQGNIQLELL